MAQKRMFSLAVTSTDDFLDLPTSSQALYFHLGMHGDDEGFVSSPKKIMRSCGANLDDLRLLASKGFIIPFDSGVIVIRDWRLNNTLKNDRFHPTIYQTERGLIEADNAGRYRVVGNVMAPNRFQDGSTLEPEHNITERNLTEQRSVADKPPARTRFQQPTLDEVRAYCAERGGKVDPQRWYDYYVSNGWRVGKNPMKNWKAAIRTWERNGVGKECSTNTSEAKRIPGVAYL